MITGVAFDGKVLCGVGQRPYLAPEYRCAAVEELEIKYKRAEGMIYLKFHTYMPRLRWW